MASILDSAVLVGKETVYGTPVTLERAYEAEADTFKKSIEYLESTGMRGGFHTSRSSRRKVINMGGEGTISTEFLTEGMGYILQACLGTATKAQIGTTTAYTETYATSSDETGDSYTVQVKRADVGGTLRAFTYHGCTVTEWSLTQNVGELMKIEWTFDSEDVDTSTAAGTNAYPDGVPFDWTQMSATWGGSALDISEFSLKGNLGLKTDRRFLRNSALKKQPIRAEIPMFDGEMTAEFENLDVYADFVAGTERELVLTWEGGEIETGTNYSFEVTIPATQFSGDTPEVTPGDTPQQSIPFKALHNGTDDAITMVYTTTDDTLIA